MKEVFLIIIGQVFIVFLLITHYLMLNFKTIKVSRNLTYLNIVLNLILLFSIKNTSSDILKMEYVICFFFVILLCIVNFMRLGIRMYKDLKKGD